MTDDITEGMSQGDISGDSDENIQPLREGDDAGARVSELENSVNILKDQLLRKAAEFENYRKRVENENDQLRRYASEAVILKLLPVMDDLERSMKAKKNAFLSADENTFLRGMELIHQKFRKVLEQEGVKHFDVIGKPFDPHYHDALMQVNRADVPPHTVVDEVEKGYMFHDKVLRHARVIVSSEQAVAGDAPAPSTDQEKSRNNG